MTLLPILCARVILLIALLGTIASAAEKLSGFSYAEFLFIEINKEGVVKTEQNPPLEYLDIATLPAVVRDELRRLPGMPRAAILRHWKENGGPRQCEFLSIAADLRIAVRIVWKPQAMPVEVFRSPALREAWILRHTPMPAEGDIAMQISKPYQGHLILD